MASGSTGSVGEPGLHSRPGQPGSERAVGVEGQRRRHATVATPEAKRDHGASRDLDRVHVAQRRLLVHPETEPVESGALLAERRRDTHRNPVNAARLAPPRDQGCVV
jgi:hypothetical protein